MGGRHFTFFPPLACFPALCALGRVAYCKFSRAFNQLFFLRLAPDGLLQLFPLFQPVTFFSAWHYALFTDLKDYKPISDQSNVFQVTENGLQIFFYLSVLNTRNKNLHSNAKSVLAEALSSCFFNDPSLSFWWAIRSLLQSFKKTVSKWKKVRGILGGEENVWRHKFKNLWNSGVRWGSTPVHKNSDIFLCESTVS